MTMADNPILELLEGEYNRNPHFAALADEVAQETIGCSFTEGMNAHPDASCSESQWLGSMKRLVCQAIFKMYEGPPGRPFDPKLYARALREVAGYATQVQGFRYEHPESGGHVHVVRDLSLPTEQKVWEMVEDQAACQQSEEAAKAEYDRCHKEMMRAIQDRQLGMAWTHYLWGTTSGAFDKPEEE